MAKYLTPLEKAAAERAQVTTERPTDVPEGTEFVKIPSFVPPPVTPFASLPDSEQKAVAQSLEEIKAALKADAVAQEVPASPPPEVVSPVEAPTLQSELESRKITHCPSCNFPIGSDPIEVAVDDKRDYMRAMLADKLFIKQYKLLNGTMMIQLRVRSMEVESLITQQLLKEIADKRLSMTDVAVNFSNYLYRRTRLLLAASFMSMTPQRPLTLPELDSPAAETMWPAKDAADAAANTIVARAERDMFKGLSEPAYHILHRTFMHFEALCLRLEENARNSDFWKEIGGLV